MWNTLKKSVYSVSHGGLFEAIRDGDFEQVKNLLELGEDPNLAKKNSSYMASHLSVIYSRLDCAILLLEKGADPNSYTELGDGGTSLYYAVRGKKICFIRLLLFFGAERAIENKYGQQVTHSHVSNQEINDFMEYVCQQVSRVTRLINTAEQYFANKEYGNAITCYEDAAAIYEKQIDEELQGTYDALYEGRKKPDNTPLIDYFYKKALRCYQSAAEAYDKLSEKGLLETAEQRNDYLELLKKITSICEKIRVPQESYARTIAVLTMHEPTHLKPPLGVVSSEFSTSPLPPSFVVAMMPQVASDSNSQKQSLPSRLYCLPTQTTFFSNNGDEIADGQETTPLLAKKNL